MIILVIVIIRIIVIVLLILQLGAEPGGGAADFGLPGEGGRSHLRQILCCTVLYYTYKMFCIVYSTTVYHIILYLILYLIRCLTFAMRPIWHRARISSQYIMRTCYVWAPCQGPPHYKLTYPSYLAIICIYTVC